MPLGHQDLGMPRWRGEPGRLEVWYATATDAKSGLGVWVHQETVAPDGAAEPYAHGWAAIFPPDGAPLVERFGPERAAPGDSGWHSVGECSVGPGWLRGRTGPLAWDLGFSDVSPPLYTFPAYAWRRPLLPAAQIVPWPCSSFRGHIEGGDRHWDVDGRGGVARIYGHGNAQRWGWLHADLPEGGTLEIVAAVGRRAGLRRLPPLAVMQLRRPGRRDWPRDPLLAAPLSGTELSASGFQVKSRFGRCRIDANVEIPAERSVALTYTDPDGSTATCTNSEQAVATIEVTERGEHESWRLEHAHAEVGTRSS